MHQLLSLRHDVWLRVCVGNALDMQDRRVEFVEVPPALLSLGHDVDLGVVDRPLLLHHGDTRLCGFTERAIGAREEGQASAVHA